jgi:hypothetical protein
MDYVKYYENQVGSGLSAFQGARYQRGMGVRVRVFLIGFYQFLKHMLCLS